jgi:glutamine amidotransferase
MIGIIDCGVGNVNAFYYFFIENSIKAKIIKSPNEATKDIKKIILIGVSSFDTMMNALNKCSFIDFIKNFVKDKSNNLLGICSGMQVLGNSSEEGTSQGLGLIEAKNFLLKNKTVPHLGLNSLDINNFCNSLILKNVTKKDYFYFLHSYHLSEIKDNTNIIFTNYDGEKIVSYINKGNIYGVQFHPEKSHDSGKKILINFCNL